ncbi:hypothetical protein Tco_1358122, partial [Tanacetum coccineum]
SGLKVNISKSRIIGVGVPSSEVEDVAASLGCASGRFTLIKSILGSLPVYYLSLFKAPQKVINILESIRCPFWGGFKESHRGLYWVKWKTILLDPKSGGLGVGCLMSKNLGLLGKWKWRFLIEDKALWNIVIKEFYWADGGFNSAVNHIGAGGIWPDIINAVKGIHQIDAGFKSSFV